MSEVALMVLKDGTVFRGRSIGATGDTTGEVVFNTAMTGYQEILTDPSYAKQMVTLTYPHIGNTGTNSEDEEARQIFCSGLIIRDLPRLPSSFRNQQDLSSYLKQNNIVAISDIDTRRLTRHIRENGAMPGCIVTADEEALALSKAQAFPGLEGMDLAKVVSVDEAYSWREGTWSLQDGHREATDLRFRVVAYDFGVKRNILRLLVDRGCELTVVPAQTPAADVMALNPDGVFLSNGPGDPEPCEYAIQAISDLLQTGKPIFGICLGHQLLSLASGATTMKMKFGHHGANHPVQNLSTGRVYITSQNHGFAVSEEDLPSNLTVTHRSLFDQTIQGVERTDCPAFSFQGHPEASPGPHDINDLFDHFIELIEASH